GPDGGADILIHKRDAPQIPKKQIRLGHPAVAAIVGTQNRSPLPGDRRSVDVYHRNRKQSRPGSARLSGPGVSAVRRAQNDALGWSRRPAHCDAVVSVDEGNALKILTRTAGLRRPSSAAIRGPKDCAISADHVADIGVHEVDGIERGARSAELRRPGISAVDRAQ